MKTIDKFTDRNEKQICFSKKRRGSNLHLNELEFPDSLCKEIWITNIKIFNVKRRKHLFLIEIHCYDGYSMIKFYPKSLKNNPFKYSLRGSEFNCSFNYSEIKKLLHHCGNAIYNYLELYPENFIGYIGQTDRKDNIEKRKRLNSQRYSIYEIFINTYFKRPKYSILNNNRFNDFNLKLIRKITNKKYSKRLTEIQKNNYNSFLNHIKVIRDDSPAMLFGFMTEATQKKYIG